MGLQDEMRVGSDLQGARWLFSGNPDSQAWVVFLVGGRAGDHSVRLEAARARDEVMIAGLTVRPLSVWSADADHCHVEVVDEGGVRHELGACQQGSGSALGDGWIGARSCARCGQPAVWLVVGLYDRGVSVAGRVMPYCDRCRVEMAEGLGMVVPLSMFALDPAGLLALMYRGGATRTAPDVVADLLGVKPGPWVRVAKEVLAGDRGLA